MYANTARRYQQVQASTLTPGELLLALYDGLFRFLRGARVCFDNGQPAKARELLSKCHQIISELMIALDYAQAPELCAQLAAVYDFCLERLIQATVQGKANPIDDVVRALTPLKEAWGVAVPDAVRNQSR